MRIVINKKYRLIRMLGVIAIYICRIHCKILGIICNSKDYIRVTQPKILEYIGSAYRNLPSHVKNGIVILLCIFESIIRHGYFLYTRTYHILSSLLRI